MAVGPVTGSNRAVACAPSANKHSAYVCEPYCMDYLYKEGSDCHLSSPASTCESNLSASAARSSTEEPFRTTWPSTDYSRQEPPCAASCSVSRERLENTRLVGNGAYAQVWKARYTADDGSVQTVAVKYLRRDALRNPGDRSLFRAEGRLMQQLDHPNIVRCLGTGQVTAPSGGLSEMYIVQEFEEGGCLGTTVVAQMLEPSRKIYSMRTAIRWMRGVADALQYLHQHGVVHRDLKLDNILLSGRNTASSTAKVTDLGLHTQAATRSTPTSCTAIPQPHHPSSHSSPASPTSLPVIHCTACNESTATSRSTGSCQSSPEAGDHMLLSGCTGSLMYMAPEVFHNQPYNHKADIFSFGVMLHEVLHRFLNVHRLPHVDAAETEQYATQVAAGFRPAVEENLPWQLKDLIKSCWDQDAARRPEAAEIVEILDEVAGSVELREYEGLRRGGSCCTIS